MVTSARKIYVGSRMKNWQLWIDPRITSLDRRIREFEIKCLINVNANTLVIHYIENFDPFIPLTESREKFAIHSELSITRDTVA